MPDVAEIAGRLSEAQRECVRQERYPERQTSRLKIQSLGLIDATGLYTPLGLAVRAYLENSRVTD